MKKIVQVPGIRRYYGDDFLDMQDTFFQMTEGVFSQYGDGVLSGCVYANNQITPGVLIYGGAAYSCPGFTGATGPWLNLLANQQSIDANQYQSGQPLPYLTENKSELAGGTGANPPVGGVGFNVFTAIRLLVDPRSEKYVSRYTPVNNLSPVLQTPRNIVTAYPNGIYCLDMNLAFKVGLDQIFEVYDGIDRQGTGTLEVKYSTNDAGTESLILTASLSPSLDTLSIIPHTSSIVYSVTVNHMDFQNTSAFGLDRWVRMPGYVEGRSFLENFSNQTLEDVMVSIPTGTYAISSSIFNDLIGSNRFPGIFAYGDITIRKSLGKIDRTDRNITMQINASSSDGLIQRVYIYTVRDTDTSRWDYYLYDAVNRDSWMQIDEQADRAETLYVEELPSHTDILSYAHSLAGGTYKTIWINEAIGAPVGEWICYNITKHANFNFGIIIATDLYNRVWTNGLVNGVWQGWMKVGDHNNVINIDGRYVWTVGDSLPVLTTTYCIGVADGAPESGGTFFYTFTKNNTQDTYYIVEAVEQTTGRKYYASSKVKVWRRVDAGTIEESNAIDILEYAAGLTSCEHRKIIVFNSPTGPLAGQWYSYDIVKYESTAYGNVTATDLNNRAYINTLVNGAWLGWVRAAMVTDILQSDWNVTDVVSRAFIKNKPAIPNIDTSYTLQSGDDLNDYAYNFIGGYNMGSYNNPDSNYNGQLIAIREADSDYASQIAITNKGSGTTGDFYYRNTNGDTSNWNPWVKLNQVDNSTAWARLGNGPLMVQYRKTSDGWVQICFNYNSDIDTNPPAMVTMPVGFRALSIDQYLMRCQLYSNTAVLNANVNITFDGSGVIGIPSNSSPAEEFSGTFNYYPEA